MIGHYYHLPYHFLSYYISYPYHLDYVTISYHTMTPHFNYKCYYISFYFFIGHLLNILLHYDSSFQSIFFFFLGGNEWNNICVCVYIYSFFWCKRGIILNIYCSTIKEFSTLSRDNELLIIGSKISYKIIILELHRTQVGKAIDFPKQMLKA